MHKEGCIYNKFHVFSLLKGILSIFSLIYIHCICGGLEHFSYSMKSTQNLINGQLFGQAEHINMNHIFMYLVLMSSFSQSVVMEAILQYAYEVF